MPDLFFEEVEVQQYAFKACPGNLGTQDKMLGVRVAEARKAYAAHDGLFEWHLVPGLVGSVIEEGNAEVMRGVMLKELRNEK